MDRTTSDAMTKPSPHSAVLAPRKRAMGVRAEDARARILGAALRVFAAHGFEGATMQEIAEIATVKLPLIVYHFKSKQKLWETVMEKLSERISARFAEVQAITGLTAADRLRKLIVVWVELGASIPEYHRIVTIEGHTNSDRLAWICDRHLLREFDFTRSLIAAAQAEGKVRDVSPDHLRYAMIGATSIFSAAAEYKSLTGKDPLRKKEVEATIDFLDKLIFIDGDETRPRMARSKRRKTSGARRP